MTNLLQETLESIESSGHTSDDVHWVGSFDAEYASSWEEFAAISDIEYDSGFGAAWVAGDLLVVFKDKTWLERSEYDGSESWSYYSPPTGSTPSGKSKKLECVIGTDEEGLLWPSLETLHEK